MFSPGTGPSTALTPLRARSSQILKTETPKSFSEQPELQKQYTSNWVWRAIAAMIDVKGLDTSALSLAEKLRQPVDTILVALDGLERLGIIRKNGSSYEKVLKYIYFSDRDLSPTDLVSDHVLISSQILSRLDPQMSSGGTFYRTSFVATNLKLIRDFFSGVETLMKKLLVDSNQAPSDQVFALTFSGVNVAPNLKSEEESP